MNQLDFLIKAILWVCVMSVCFACGFALSELLKALEVIV